MASAAPGYKALDYTDSIDAGGIASALRSAGRTLLRAAAISGCLLVAATVLAPQAWFGQVLGGF